MKYKNVLFSLTDFEIVGLEIMSKRMRKPNKSEIVRDALRDLFAINGITDSQLEKEIKNRLT